MKGQEMKDYYKATERVPAEKGSLGEKEELAKEAEKEYVGGKS